MWNVIKKSKQMAKEIQKLACWAISWLTLKDIKKKKDLNFIINIKYQ
jgi:hypothetical protein